MNILKNRRFRHGTMATVITAGFIAVVVLLNVILSILVARFPLKLDLTKNNVYNLTQESADFTKKISEKIDIVVFASNETEFTSVYAQTIAGYENYATQALEMVKKFAQTSSQINLQFVDLNKNPTYTQEYSSDNLTATDILVKSGKRYKILTVYDLYNIQQDQTYGYYSIASSKTEESMLSALMFVTSTNPTKVLALTGHSEEDSSALTGILKSNNYEIEEATTLTGNLDQNAKMLILNAPKTDYSNDEIAKIENFLVNNENYGKSLLYFTAAGQPHLPKLEAFLEEWGIKVGDGSLYETNSSMVFMNEPNFTVHGVHEDESTVDANSTQILMYGARPLEQVFTERGAWTTQVMLESEATAVIKPKDADAQTFDPGKLKKEAYPSAILSTKTVEKAIGGEFKSYIFAVGSSEAINTSLMNTVFHNAAYFLDQCNQIVDKEDSVSILPKEVGGNMLSYSQFVSTVIGMIFMIGVPALILIAGTIIWLRRRHR